MDIRTIYNLYNLATIGSYDDYMLYIETIYPDSKLQDIFWHGSIHADKIYKKGFQKKYIGKNSNSHNKGFYFTNSISTASTYVESTFNKYTKLPYEKRFLAVKIYTKNPYLIDCGGEYFTPSLNNFINETYGDTIILTNIWDTKEPGYYADFHNFIEIKDIANTIVTFNENNIHILGSEKDKKLFKNFIKALQD